MSAWATSDIDREIRRLHHKGISQSQIGRAVSTSSLTVTKGMVIGRLRTLGLKNRRLHDGVVVIPTIPVEVPELTTEQKTALFDHVSQWWPPDKLTSLCLNWIGGKSIGDIGRLLGVSSNAAGKKARRLVVAGILQKRQSPILDEGKQNWRKAVWATEERLVVLRQWYPTYMLPPEIVRRMEAFAGTPLPPWNTIGTYAIESLGLRRPADFSKKTVAARFAATKKTAPSLLRAPEPLPTIKMFADVPGLRTALGGVPGSSGIPLVPISRPWPTICDMAMRDGYHLSGYHGLSGYNKSRISRYMQPLVIYRKTDGGRQIGRAA